MRTTLLVALIFASVGCQSQQGGLLYRQAGRADDPRYSIEEQKRRGRERLAVVEDTGLSPKTYVDRPGVTGR
ncbi:MAG: hypothetical protein K1X57_03440 [Gemmataceae bacterium]|nr:hypothetical protein [Gemmataceae bacterium]